MSRRADQAVEVLVVDDDEQLRRAVTAVVAAQPDLVVVGETGDGDQAVAMAAELVPAVVLLDLRMPGTDGIAAARAINDGLPNTRVIMLTTGDEEDDLYRAIRAGASGYVLKDSALDEVGVSIRTVAAGQAVLSPSIAAKLVSEFTNADGCEPIPETIRCLSGRELEILRLVTEGHSNRQIAQQLYISPHTVKRHMANILAKLHQRTRLDAVLYAQREHLLE